VTALPSAGPWEPITVGGRTVVPGETSQLEIRVARLFTGDWLALPMQVLHGPCPGPCVCLSATLHGDEINGLEIIRRVLHQVNVLELCGTIVAAPVVNVFGFLHQDRYLPDRRDLNRCFPGSRTGSLASRLANFFVTEVLSRCQYAIDYHTGSLHRDNLPQIRAQLDVAETRRLAEVFGAPMIFQAPLVKGSLRQTAVKRGVHLLLFEGGEPLRFNDDAITTGVVGTMRVLKELAMVEGSHLPPPAAPFVGRRTRWVRASRSGIFHPSVELGQRVERGQSLGLIAYDVFGQEARSVAAPLAGLVIGQTRIPLVNRGDALVHLAGPKPEPARTPPEGMVSPPAVPSWDASGGGGAS
jgi:predicted deacylase